MVALKVRKEQQTCERDTHARRWKKTGLVFTTRYGTPIEPRNFNRSFDYRINKAEVRRLASIVAWLVLKGPCFLPIPNKLSAGLCQEVCNLARDI